MREEYFESRVLAKKIVDFKKRNNLTYQQLGEALEVDKSYLNRVAKLNSYMSLPVLIRLANYMGIPLYALFMPSEELIREDFVETVKKQMNALGLLIDDLAIKTGISPIRVMEILDGNSSITNTEYDLLTEALNIPYKKLYREDQLTLLETIIHGLDLPESKKENVIKYIKENLE